MTEFEGYIYDFDEEEDIIWFYIIDETGKERDYECSFSFVVDGHHTLIEKGVYIHMLEDDDTGQCIIAVDEPRRWTQEEVDEAQKRGDDLWKAIHWE